MSARTWMTATTAIHQSLLRNICLPSSHDSGTYALQDIMSPQYGSWVQDIVNLIGEVAAALNKIPLLGKFINAPEWVYSAVIPAVKGLATATTRTIAQQLNDGVRCLDLRICYFGKDFYTYHGLLGSKVSDILNDIKQFMQSTNGEIVYITMGHWAGFDNQNLYTQFATMVSDALGAWAYVPQTSSGTITNNPFNQTYAQIIGQGGVTKSRVILVNGQAPANSVFWPLAYSPPDNGPNENNPAAGTVIDGYYTNTTDLNTMVQTQKQQQQSAILPFALYMTLTPQSSDYVGIVITSLYSALLSLAKSLALIPIIGPMLATAVLAVAAGLYIGQLGFPWRTLEQLSAKVDTQLTDLIFNNFASPGQPSNIAFLYVDYYEKTSVVDLAVSLSVANAPSQVPQLPIIGVNEYSATSSGAVRYNFSTSKNPATGWRLVLSNVFRGSSKQTGNSVSIYSLYQSNDAGWNFRLSTNGTPPPGWAVNAIAFYAFVDAADGLVPIYEYSASNPTFTTIYFYSTSPQVSGWTRTGNVFYAFSAPLIPIYAQQAAGPTRYNWSATNVPVAGSGWSPGAAVFEASTVQQGDAVPVYQYYSTASTAGWNYLLSMSATPPAGFQLSGLLCYAFPSYQAGLAPVRQFTKTDSTFGTLYQYLPVARVDDWTTGPVMFYAALPPLAGMSEDVNVLDIAALAAFESA